MKTTEDKELEEYRQYLKDVHTGNQAGVDAYLNQPGLKKDITNIEFRNACKMGDLEKVRSYFVEQSPFLLQNNTNEGLNAAICEKHRHIVEYLLLSSEIREPINLRIPKVSSKVHSYSPYKVDRNEILVALVKENYYTVITNLVEVIPELDKERDLFITACEVGNVEIIKFLCNLQDYTLVQNEIGKALYYSAKHGNKQLYNAVFSSDNAVQYTLSQETLDSSFLANCRYGRLDMLDFVLKNSQCQLSSETINTAFKEAVTNNQISSLEYLKNHGFLENVFKPSLYSTALKLACNKENFSMATVQYLMEDQEFKQHINYGSLVSVFDKAARNQNKDLLNYLIMDIGIKKTAGFVRTLSENGLEDSIKIFDSKALHDKLESQLSNNATKVTKTKI